MDGKTNSGKRRWRTRIAPLAVCAALIVLVVWYLRGRALWSDGGSVRIAQAEADAREVLWTTPRPLAAELFGYADPEAPQQQEQQQIYEPSLSPDGAELYFVRGKPGAGAHL